MAPFSTRRERKDDDESSFFGAFQGGIFFHCVYFSSETLTNHQPAILNISISQVLIIILFITMENVILEQSGCNNLYM